MSFVMGNVVSVYEQMISVKIRKCIHPISCAWWLLCSGFFFVIFFRLIVSITW